MAYFGNLAKRMFRIGIRAAQTAQVPRTADALSHWQACLLISAFTRVSDALWRQSADEPDLRDVRPRVEMIGRHELELYIAGGGRRQLAFLIAGFEQQPVGERAFSDRAERAVCPLIPGQNLDLLRIVVVAADNQHCELVYASRLLVLESIDGVGVAPGPDLDPLVLLATRDLAPALVRR